MKRRTQVISGGATNISLLLDGSNIFKDSVDDVVIVIHYIFQKVNIAEKSLEPRYYKVSRLSHRLLQIYRLQQVKYNTLLLLDHFHHTVNVEIDEM